MKSKHGGGGKGPEMAATCPEEGRVEAWLAGEAREEEREAIRGHLAACASCRAMVERFGNVKDLVHSVRLPEMPLGFWSRQRLRIMRRLHRQSAFWKAPAYSLTALALFVGAYLWFGLDVFLNGLGRFIGDLLSPASGPGFSSMGGFATILLVYGALFALALVAVFRPWKGKKKRTASRGRAHPAHETRSRGA